MSSSLEKFESFKDCASLDSKTSACLGLERRFPPVFSLKHSSKAIHHQEEVKIAPSHLKTLTNLTSAWNAAGTQCVLFPLISVLLNPRTQSYLICFLSFDKELLYVSPPFLPLPLHCYSTSFINQKLKFPVPRGMACMASVSRV